MIEYRVKKIYKALLIGFTMLNMIQLLNPYLVEYTGHFIFVGFLILGYDIFIKRTLTGNRHKFVLLALTASYLVTLFLNRQDLHSNSVMLAYSVAQMFLMYSYDATEKEQNVISEILLINKVIGVFTMAMSALSILMFLTGFQIKLMSRGHETILGYSEGRLTGLYINANPGAALTMISLLVSVLSIIILRNQKDGLKPQKGWKSFFYVNLIVEYCYLVLSNTRGVSLPLVMVFPILFAFDLHPLCGLLFQKKKQIMAACVIGALCLTQYLYLCMQPVRSVLAETALLIQYTDKMISSDEKVDFEDLTIGLDREGEGLDSNGRFNVWQSGLNMWKKRPVWGVGYHQISKVEMHPGVYVYHMHNVFLQVLVANGIIGLLLFLCFGVLCARDFLRFFWRKLKKHSRSLNTKIVLCIFVLLLAQALNNLFETNLFLSDRTMSFVFWLYLGYGMYFLHRDMQKVKEAQPEDEKAISAHKSFPFWKRRELSSGGTEKPGKAF